ncbi:4'-phosphopantetheinyl transferase family protein [Fructilactobacillus florum]|uniref:4'-phosphopantetheinyl transferase domain-containing protein n=1 Tax=Fructilactobacillus florum DSM 22689 = JCM 16035 TaxID=1423745 RepID=A0A0R2CRF4_9LACO|nr:4'-phosphopantetheinyl transferase superfamily protein [Fructilactobacillus florum]KRM92324.1 hypothetical protein FC87_GL000457 [Fructilactobacillus florum DSM 22689 = JCM 16035]
MFKYRSGWLSDVRYQSYYQQLGIIKQPKRQQTVVGKILLAELLGLPEQQFLTNPEFEIGPAGKPFFSHRPEYFNISHSNQLVVAAIADVEIGIDVEKQRSMTLSKYQRAFTAAELSYLRSLTPTRQAVELLRLWTVKEAVIKQQGLGLFSAGPRSVAVTVPRMEAATYKQHCFAIHFLGIDTAYVGSLALNEIK